MKVKKIFIDCDGVLTDGRLNISQCGGKLFKAFHTRDIRAIRELVFNGYEVTIVSSDDWPGGQHFAEKVGADFRYMRDKNLNEEEYIAIGDDAWDVPMLKKATIGFCPSDSDKSVKKLKNVITLETEGGRGVMAEVCRRLLS